MARGTCAQCSCALLGARRPVCFAGPGLLCLFYTKGRGVNSTADVLVRFVFLFLCFDS